MLGNGEIDFEEFLTLMTSTEKFLENLRGKPILLQMHAIVKARIYHLI